MVTLDSDVLVVGAGPTGLLLAGDLAALGVRCTVLEKRAEESNLTRAFVVHARTLEQFDIRGIAEKLIKTGKIIGTMQLFGRLDLDLSTLPCRFPFLVSTPQYETERVLEERAVELGVRIVRGAGVVGLQQELGHVGVTVRAEDGDMRTWSARYVVGADGVHSAVRSALGLPFPGHSAVRSVMLADVRLREAPERELVVNANSAGLAFIASFGDGWHRIIAWDRQRELPDSAPVTLAEISDVVHRTLGTDYGMHDARWMSRFHSDERQVPRYRVGRVFLAGDAASAHSPAGAQGMNTALQDAANLGWKIAASLQGWATEGLLDTYHTERHPVDGAVMHTSGTILRLALAPTLRLRLARTALPLVAGSIGAINRRLSRTISGIGTRYPAPPGAHRLTGTRAPDIALAGGGPARLFEALRTGHFVFLAPRDFPTTVSGPWHDRVDHLNPADPKHPMMLIRPDGYIAWATDDKNPKHRESALLTALNHRDKGDRVAGLRSAPP